MIFVGLVAAVVLYRFLSVRLKITDAAFFCFGILLLASVAIGFVFAYLFQKFYDIIVNVTTGTDKPIDWKNGGVTFMGGLVGGVACFFIASIISLRGENRRQIWNVTCLAPAAITAAHAFGRIGCFLAGCCYGKTTDSWIGVQFPGDNYKVIPTQLIEAVFLFHLCAVLLILIFNRRYGLTMIIYLFSYSVFRFILEFYRGDPARGQFGGLWASQWQSIFMFLCAAALTVYIFAFKRIPFNGKQQGDLTKFLYEKEEPAPPQPVETEGKSGQ